VQITPNSEQETKSVDEFDEKWFGRFRRARDGFSCLFVAERTGEQSEPGVYCRERAKGPTVWKGLKEA
jgi:hypothetical protein